MPPTKGVVPECVYLETVDFSKVKLLTTLKKLKSNNSGGLMDSIHLYFKQLAPALAESLYLIYEFL